jgi:release factor glutamine methyltransferase
LTKNPGESFNILTDREVYAPDDDSFLLGDCMKVNEGSHVLDMGTGTGILAIKAVLLGASRVLAIDINPYASRCALKNIASNGLRCQVSVLTGNLFSQLRENAMFDVILFNPPYLQTNATEYAKGWLEKSWAGGGNGRTLINQFVDYLPAHLKREGIAFILHPSGGIKATIRRLRMIEMDASIVAKKKLFFEELLVISARHNRSTNSPRRPIRDQYAQR